MCFVVLCLCVSLLGGDVVDTIATEAATYAGKAEEAFDLALDYFRSADDVYHQVKKIIL